MAYKGSLFQVLDESGKIKGELVFDSIVSEAHEVSNKVTEFPVDTGFVVSDHVIRKNRVLTMDIVSVRHAMEGRQRGGLTAGKHNKIKEDFDLLNEMVQKGLRCNVVTIHVPVTLRTMYSHHFVPTQSLIQPNLLYQLYLRKFLPDLMN